MAFTAVSPLDSRHLLCYNDPMKNKKSIKPFRKPVLAVSTAAFTHLTESNALRGGEGAFKIRVPIYNNPYNDNPLKSAWIRGYKRAERQFFESVKNSQRVQATIGFEEVEA